MQTVFKYKLLVFILVVSFTGFCSCKTTIAAPTNENTGDSGAVTNRVNVWLTTPDTTHLIAPQASLTFVSSATSNTLTITIEEQKAYQTIDGFGYTLTGGSATLLNQLGPNQAAVLNELFGTKENQLGISYLRLSIGASDLSAYPYTYNEVQPGLTDVNLDKFSIDIEKTDLIPILKKVLAINPNIKIIATPWTAPTWMKVNTNSATA
jgi:glucosylceramidase